jgi:hypothetical protein
MIESGSSRGKISIVASVAMSSSTTKKEIIPNIKILLQIKKDVCVCV